MTTEAQDCMGSEPGEPGEDRWNDAHVEFTRECQGSPFSEERERQLTDEEFRNEQIREVCKLAGCDSHAEEYIERGVSLQAVMQEMAREVRKHGRPAKVS